MPQSVKFRNTCHLRKERILFYFEMSHVISRVRLYNTFAHRRFGLSSDMDWSMLILLTGSMEGAERASVKKGAYL
jgi:hypothetical protein